MHRGLELGLELGLGLSLLVWWNGSVVAVQTVGSAVRILLELSFSFSPPHNYGHGMELKSRLEP